MPKQPQLVAPRFMAVSAFCCSEDDSGDDLFGCAGLHREIDDSPLKFWLGQEDAEKKPRIDKRLLPFVIPNEFVEKQKEPAVLSAFADTDRLDRIRAALWTGANGLHHGPAPAELASCSSPRKITRSDGREVRVYPPRRGGSLVAPPTDSMAAPAEEVDSGPKWAKPEVGWTHNMKASNP